MSSAVIITAAGSSRRFNSSSENTGLKKEFLCIDDLPILCHAILPFLQMEDLAVLAVTYREGDLETVRKLGNPFCPRRSNQAGIGFQCS